MSVEAFSWALSVPIGGNAKIVLLGLANHAHPDGTETYPVLDTLAKYAHCHRDTVRRALRELVTTGWITEDGLGPKGQGKYVLSMGGCNLQSPPQTGGGKSDDGGVAPVQPEPSLGTVHRTTSPSEVLAVELIDAKAQEVCDAIVDLVQVVFDGKGFARRVKVTPAWLAEIEKAHRLDGYSWEAMLRCVAWLKAGNSKQARFWRTNIRSAKKLREQLPTMVAQAKAEREAAPPRASATNTALEDAMARLDARRNAA